MLLEDELLKNEKYYELAREISEAFQKAKYAKRIEKINSIIKLLEQKNLSFINYLPKDVMIDILSELSIRVIINEQGYLIQIFDKNGYGQDVDNLKKEVILKKLIEIDSRFKSVYSKVYGEMRIDYQNIEKEEVNDLILKLIYLKVEI